MTAAPVSAWIVASAAGLRALAVPLTHCDTCGLTLPADHHYLRRAA